MRALHIVLIVILSLIVACELFIFFSPSNEKSLAHSVEVSAAAVIDACKDDGYRPFCYEKEVPKLLDTLPVEEVFNVIRIIKSRDAAYQFCHVLAHELGEQEVAKDPKNWIDVIAHGPSDGLCSNGFIHGAAVSRFNKEVLNDEEINTAIPELSIACEPRDSWHPSGLDQAICYHGIGHVLVHLTGAHIEKSLDICARVALKKDGRDYRQVCTEGVFMQLFQPLEPEDYALINTLEMEPTKENHGDFCAAYPLEARSACWREGWPLHKDELTTAEGIIGFCAVSENEQQELNCFNTVLAIKGRQGLEDPENASELCNAFPSNLAQVCFSSASTAYLEEDRGDGGKAVAFCAYAHDESIEDGCYEHLAATADFVFQYGSKRQLLCELLPTPWREKCEIGVE